MTYRKCNFCALQHKAENVACRPPAAGIGRRQSAGMKILPMTGTAVGLRHAVLSAGHGTRTGCLSATDSPCKHLLFPSSSIPTTCSAIRAACIGQHATSPSPAMERPPLRILTFLHSFEPGGVERIALRLVREWRDGGVSAPLFMGRSSGAMREELAGDLSYHTPRLPPFAIDWCETIWMILTLPGVIRRLRPDLLFCAGNSYSIVAVAMKLILGRDCPPVLAKISNDLDRHDMIRPARPLYRLWLRIQGRFIDHFVGMEDAMEQEIATLVQPPPGRITIIRDPALSFAQIDRLRALPRRLPCGDGRHFVANARHQTLEFGRIAPAVGQGQKRERMDTEHVADRRNFAERRALHATFERAQIRAAGHVRKRLLAQATRFAGHLERSGERTFRRHP